MFKLMTDSACDLPQATLRDHDVDVVALHVLVNNQEVYLTTDNVAGMHDFYQQLGAGHTATTSQVSVGEFVAAFEPYVRNDTPVLYLAFDSALSGTFAGAVQARRVIQEDYPHADITIADSRAASCGLGMMLLDVIKLRDQGQPAASVAAWVQQHRHEYHHVVTIDDLHYLVAGGRLKASAAKIGALLNLHPILELQEDGAIVVRHKVRTFGKSLRFLAQQAGDALGHTPHPTVMIVSSADATTTAKLADAVRQVLPTAQITSMPVGTVLASHTGPGCCAVFFRTPATA
ncbi:DegV family protein [Lacticaseibacillus thailandensis]|uniref:DegV family protein n=1 Tax=Lacticaseibacillus thailandensis DSM 22698 = JCM 13996 TaxID=1423810 RepID=A0A0R2C7B6_9LACO|nr:DegV family protein [Lacticaseibacillus thailandensis]KRM87216.1 DegV family protein [Lacticaseibacillus thailandensis DSM 22698 = JCM 13996]